jgi:hypothetical protein
MSEPGDGSGGKNSEAEALVELLKLVEPVVSATKDGPMGIALLLDDMGVSEELIGGDAAQLYETIESDVSQEGAKIDAAVTSVVGQVQSVPDIEGIHELDDVDWQKVFDELDPQDLLSSLESIVDSVKGIYGTVEMLQQIEIQDPDMGTLGDQVFDFLVIRYLKIEYGQLYGFMKTFGVITSRDGNHSGPENIDLSKFAEAIEDPNEIPKELLGWAKKSQPFLATLLLQRLLTVFWGKHIPANLNQAGKDTLEGATGKPSNVLESMDEAGMDGWGQKLMVPLLGMTYADGQRAETGLQIVPLPPKDSQFLPGLALVTYGTIASGMSGDIGDDWTIGVEGDGELANRGVAINPGVDSGLNFDFVNTEGSQGSTPGGTADDQLVFTVNLEYAGDSDGMQKPLVGTAVGRLDMDGLSVSTTFEYANDQFQFGAEFSTTGTISLDPQGGFLDTVIPKPISYDFDVTLGWSTTTGLYLQNGGTLMISIADNIPLGPLRIKETFLGLDLGERGQSGTADSDGPPRLPMVFSSTPKLDIGFLTAEVMRTGIEADLSFPGGTEGNLGPADLDLGFKPPKGLSLSVDAGPVTGGGMLEFFPDENRYSGALQLAAGPLSLSAIGVLKTKLPGGGDGYSFLILITAEFPPVQLGFGFTLNGVGGLFGLHRGMKTDVLGRKIRSGNVGSVLFPENVVENAQQILSDLRAIFPPKQDVHVVGPMVEMGWGTPTMLTLEVGIVLEIPTFEIAIVGAFHLNMPDEEAPLVTINLAVLGVLDIPDERLAITASLYDSRIVMWTVSGDMAMRLRWGDDARFMLSIGGFHPRYDPPKGFPELDRVKASMSPPGVPARLEYSGYLATTPNTFQVGAGVVLHAEAGPARVHGELSFDALFQFDPFKFVVDFLASFAVEIKGHGLSVKIDGTLQGPGPMRVTGKVHIEILFFEVTVNVDVTMGSGGDQEQLPPAKVMPKLLDELDAPGNWAAQVPKNAQSLVSIRDSEAEAATREGANGADSEPETVLAHPLGGVEVRQTVVPLNQRIEKFGEMVPRDYESFRIAEVRVDDTPLGAGPLMEQFAPAKYTRLSDSEKLNSPSFVEREAGRGAGSGLLYYPGTTESTSDSASEMRRTAKLTYETSVVDEARETHAAPLGTLGGFERLRPEAARFGVPLVELPDILAASEFGRRRPIETDGAGGDPRVYGVPGATVLGEREDRTLAGDSLGGRTPGDGVVGTPDGTVGGGSGDTGLGDTGLGDDIIDETVVDGVDRRVTGGLRDGPGVINLGGGR